ncbi:sigma-54-dependent Fis family transcriptional regulator [bacterium]|nr:sigma-54-dependent Fis family transcriptional regulator [candidate division CSSED10-310 bacterium]
MLIRIIEELSSIQSKKDLIRFLIRNAVEFTQAERGFFIEQSQERDLVFYDVDGQIATDPEVSRSTIRAVFANHRPVCLVEDSDGHSIPPTASILALDLKTIMCAPLSGDQEGDRRIEPAVLYVDSQIYTRPFDRLDLEFFTILARHAVVVLDNLVLTQALQNDFKLLHQEVKSRFGYHRIVGECEEMKRVYDTLEMIRNTDLDVMIVGDTGTGKELIAKAIHYSSRRSEAPLKQINCAALPEGLVEAELFGLERSVATEVRKRTGKMEQADGGTLFLDEIGDMAFRVQNRLLRFLENRQFRRIGGREEISVDVRVLAATNKDLEKEIREGRFRDALRFRLDIVTIRLPRLRDRGEDLHILAEYFLEEVVQAHHLEISGFTTAAWDLMRRYSWPGNVRELKHRIHSAAFLARGPLIDVQDLGLHHPPDRARARSLKERTEEFERNFITRILVRHVWDRKQTAKALGISENVLNRKMKSLDINP